jgi:hypothetical protein
MFLKCFLITCLTVTLCSCEISIEIGDAIENSVTIADNVTNGGSDFDYRADNDTDFSWIADYNISDLEPSELFFPSESF